ncbi:hypothetical protein, partial [Streptomyces sp. KR55]|uniref:hypothetical protein n=1 Tax=Streptomyces sp. KR55 TaxID=3457425 RepID=UPI003FD4CA86
MSKLTGHHEQIEAGRAPSSWTQEFCHTRSTKSGTCKASGASPHQKHIWLTLCHCHHSTVPKLAHRSFHVFGADGDVTVQAGHAFR